MTPSISSKDVEALIERLEYDKDLNGYCPTCGSSGKDQVLAAQTLRQLVAERDALTDRATTAEARVGELEDTVAMYRAGTLAAFDALCPTCKGSATVSERTRSALSPTRESGS